MTFFRTSLAFGSLLLIGSIGKQVKASEIDSFTARYQRIPDARPIIEAQTQVFWAEAIAEANDTRRGCSTDRLYDALRKRFNNHLVGAMSKWLRKSKELPTKFVPVSESIYGALSFGESVVLSTFSGQGMDRLVRIREHDIGLDKFEHFWGSGFQYFNKGYLSRETPSVVPGLKQGLAMEGGLFGATMTGVHSYGDLVANFNGLRFWNHVLALYPDPLGRSQQLGPYVTCRDNRWVTLKTPKWADYIDAGWDEGVNCSAFRTDSMMEKVESHLRKLHEETGMLYRCPMTRKFNRSLWRKYGELSDDLLNHDGFKSLETEKRAGRR
jgi:hypothetical protein